VQLYKEQAEILLCSTVIALLIKIELKLCLALLGFPNTRPQLQKFSAFEIGPTQGHRPIDVQMD
jgi:hypothetical protein